MFICHLYVSLDEVSVQIFCHFLIKLSIFLLLNFMSYFIHMKCAFWKYFSPCGLSFRSLNSVFCRAEVSNFNKNPFFLMDFTRGVVSKNSMPNGRPPSFCLYFFSRGFIVLHLICRFMIHSELIIYVSFNFH